LGSAATFLELLCSEVPDVVLSITRALADKDLAWLRATFAPEQLTVFAQGGHLGNLFNPAVQKSILAALTPMKPPEPKAK